MDILKLFYKIKNKLSVVKPNVRFNWPDPRSIMGGNASYISFVKEQQSRREKYKYDSSERGFQYAKEIEKHGFIRIENCIDLDKINKLKNQVEILFDNGEHILGGINLSQNQLRDNKLFIAIKEPFMNVSSVCDFAFEPLFLDIATAYLDCLPALGTCNLRKSFVNSLTEDSTQLYHVDPNSPKFLKFFIYLDDVNINGGPFSYIDGSHKEKFKGWQKKYRWQDSEIVDIYGKDRVRVMTGNKGDLIIADTNGWHRGVKPISIERTMLTLDYVCHEEDFGSSNRFSFPKEYFDKLPDSQKPLCDFLNINAV